MPLPRLARASYTRAQVQEMLVELDEAAKVRTTQIIHDRLKEQEELRRITDTDAKFDTILKRLEEANHLSAKFDKRVSMLEKGATRIVNWGVLIRDWRAVGLFTAFAVQVVLQVWNAFYGVAHPLPHP